MKKTSWFSQTIICFLLLLLSLTTVYPLLYTFTMSFSTAADAAKQGFHVFPKEWTLASYRIVLSSAETYTGYMNSLMRTIVGTLLGLVVTAMTAYPLSKNYMPNKKIYSFLVLFTMLFDGGLVASYLVIVQLGLIDNRLVYILPMLVTAYNVSVLKSYYCSLPESLAESAKIDGAGEFLTLFRIILPICKPVLATIALWLAVGHWNAWTDAMLYINSDDKLVLQIFLQRIITRNQTDMLRAGIMAEDVGAHSSKTIQGATIMITVLPILAVYPFVQKYFVKGVTLGAVKG